MQKFFQRLLVVSVLTAFGSLAWAAETKEEKLTSDDTQQQYQRKSITYLGMVLESGVRVDADYLATAEKAIRAKTELKRFDYNQVSLNAEYNIDKFVADLREYVKNLAVDRAATEAEFEVRFKQARVYAKDVERIMNSAYFYHIKVYVLKVKRGKCPDGKLEAALLGCIPGTEGMIATINATTTFYRANLIDESKPAYTLVKEVRHGSPVKGFKSFKVIEVQPEHMERIRKETGLAAVALASNTLADFLSKGMKQIPDFQLKTPVTAALSDGVEFMLGSGEGVGLDDTYDVTEFDQAGEKTLLGYVKVRDIGDAKGSGEGTPSYAEKVKEKRKFVGGEQPYSKSLSRTCWAKMKWGSTRVSVSISTKTWPILLAGPSSTCPSRETFSSWTKSLAPV